MSKRNSRGVAQAQEPIWGTPVKQMGTPPEGKFLFRKRGSPGNVLSALTSLSWRTMTRSTPTDSEDERLSKRRALIAFFARKEKNN